MIGLRALTAAVAGAAVLGSVGAGVTAYAFRGAPDGAFPYAGLVAGANGILYGTASTGGSEPCHCGIAFSLTHAGGGLTETVLHAFAGGADGAQPLADLATDATGALYGTTFKGGSACECGTVFKLTPTGDRYVERVLYAFAGGNDGAFPQGGVTFGADGALYGTTTEGGSAGAGTAFRLQRTGSHYRETIVHTFLGMGAGDGSKPVGDLIAVGDTLYGVTENGGSNGAGTVFALARSGSTFGERLLYAFGYGAGGTQYPGAGLVAGKHGTFFGTTQQGGHYGNGIVYALVRKKSGYLEHAIHAFSYTIDGAQPIGLTIAADGTMYGTTMHGAGIGSNACAYPYGCGTVFRLKPTAAGYVFTTLHRFQGGGDGAVPEAEPILSGAMLYGTTRNGGGVARRACVAMGTRPGCGTVFMVRP
jgi:uncharacterized repeat protein (TIGR03803 family)